MPKGMDEIEMDAAAEPVQRIYRDVQYTLRFGDVPWLFRVLGAHESFLDAAWKAIKPIVTEAFEHSADQIRAQAVALISESLGGADLSAKLQGESLNSEALDLFTETALAYHFVTPKLTLISHALSDALADRPASVKSIVVMPTGRGVPHGMPAIERVAVNSDSSVLSEIKKARSLDFVPDYARALVQWPDGLSALWDELGSASDDAKYSKIMEGLSELTDDAVAQLRRRMDLNKAELEALGIDESERSEIVKKVDTACDLYSKSLVDVAHAALLLAGPEAAAMSGAEFTLRWRYPRSRSSAAV